MLQRDEQGALVPGVVLHNRYRIDAVLGRGGFAQTYKALDLGLNQRAVAIKEYLPSGITRIGSDGSVLAGSAGSGEFVRGRGSFINEAIALSAIKHPHVVDVLERFEANGTAYLVLAYEPGQTLEQWLADDVGDEASRKRKLPAVAIDANFLIELSLALLDALAVVHDKGRLHGDIKPANIILRPPTPGGSVVNPVLIDFGAARGDFLSRTATIMAVASAGYSPPEQYESDHDDGGAGVLTPASDLYALGATLYRVATGRVPMVSTKRMSALAYRKPDPLPNVRSAAPPARFESQDAALLDWIDGLMQVDVRQRPEGALAALKQLRTLTRSSAALPSSKPAPTRPVAEHERFAAPVKPAVAAPPEPTPKPEPRPSVATNRASNLLPWVVVTVLVMALGYALMRPGKESPPVVGQSDAARVPQTTSQTVPQTAQASPTQSPASTVSAAPTVGQPYRRALKSGGEGPEMVVIPGGSFVMGSPDSEKDRTSDEGPQRRVSIQSFAMGVTELRFADWDRCVAAGGCTHRPDDAGWGRDERPVMRVSWEDAQAYVRWLSAETGRRYRLPTEAEWEYAARAGTVTAYWWGDEIDRSRANYGMEDGSGGKAEGADRWKYTSPVKSFSPNPWGLYDTSGNVWEWVQDCYQDSYRGAPVDGSAVESSGCELRVLRGASWLNRPSRLRSADRNWNVPTLRDDDVGFRLAEDL